jgi:phosphoribosylanthranilate isomerase
MNQNPVQIKVCGITNLEDALYLEAQEVEFLGFNFVKKSPRYVSPQKANEIIQELSPSTLAVGVFQNQSKEEIEQILSICDLDLLQFHGSESPELLAQFEHQKIKVFSVTDDFDPQVLTAYNDVADYFLFDSKVGNIEGGTGQIFDWSRIENISKKPFFLAGGIGPKNILEAWNQVKPWAFDLNSKIEVKPGLKDPLLFVECMEALGK